MTPPRVSSVYLHAPFCARRCFYCDFAVTVRRDPDPKPWLAAVERELEALEAEGSMTLAPQLETLYVGGGTPSLLGPAVMEGLAGILSRDRLDEGTEWTAEANPESLTPSVAAGWRRAGVSRVSMGTQSFHEGALRWMGRLHGPDGAEAAVGVARRAGFESFSIDLIFGLPATVGRDWSADLDRVLALDVPHLSLYGLTAESGTPLGRAVSEGRLELADEARYEDEYLEAAERLTAAGYEHYEVSNFARPGHRSRHNQVYWSGRPYLGLGSGAHSFLPPIRRWNVRDWADYEACTGDGRLPVAGEERVEGSARRLEQVWLGLRTVGGLPVDWPPGGGVARRVAAWASAGLVVIERRRLRATARGWLVLDRLTVELVDLLERTGTSERVPGPLPSSSSAG